MKAINNRIIKRSIRLILLFTTIFTLFLLVSCSNDSEANVSPSSNGNDNITDSNTNEPKETEPEPFDMQEPTNKLTLYTVGMTGITINPAVNIFKEMYPEVEVEVKSFSDDEYRTILPTELASGKGPDLVFSFTSDVADIYKMMSTGVFVDLNHFINNDEDFHIEDYVEGAFNGGILHGKRYIMPVEYGISTWVAFRDILENEGLSEEDISTYDKLLNTMAKCHEKHKDDPEYYVMRNSSITDADKLNSMWFSDLLDVSKIEFIDYENNKVSIDKDKFKTLMDTVKALRYPEGETISRGGGFWDGKCLLMSYNSVNNLFWGVYGDNSDNNCIAFPFPSYKDEAVADIISYAAITSASQNQVNAYRLLKILLSPEIQGGDNGGYSYLRIGSPVLISAIRENKIVAFTKEMHIDLTDEQVDSLMDMLTNIKTAKILPSAVIKFITDEMTPYLNGSKTFDECYSRLETTLELYKDE